MSSEKEDLEKELLSKTKWFMFLAMVSGGVFGYFANVLRNYTLMKPWLHDCLSVIMFFVMVWTIWQLQSLVISYVISKRRKRAKKMD